MRIILQLAALLLQRRGEITGMMTDELNLDQGLWLIPGERMKGGLPHLVPLPPEAVKLITRALVLADEVEERKRKEGEKLEKSNSRPVFPSPRGHGKSVLANSVTHAMKEITTALGIEGVSPHDLRRTGSTALTSERIGVSPFIRSKVLGHSTDAGGGAAVSSVHYDANSYIAEKRRALSAWETLLEEIVRRDG
jgi:integrase